MKLPPLPSPTVGMGDHCWSYGADDMRVYADQAVVDERARVLDWFDDALADLGLCWPGEIDILRDQIASGRVRGKP